MSSQRSCMLRTSITVTVASEGQGVRAQDSQHNHIFCNQQVSRCSELVCNNKHRGASLYSRSSLALVRANFFLSARTVCTCHINVNREKRELIALQGALTYSKTSRRSLYCPNSFAKGLFNASPQKLQAVLVTISYRTAGTFEVASAPIARKQLRRERERDVLQRDFMISGVKVKMVLKSAWPPRVF